MLNARELQVPQLIAESDTTREVAAQLNLYRQDCRVLMGRAASLLRYAVRRGLMTH
jgi:hypothetical protein